MTHEFGEGYVSFVGITCVGDVLGMGRKRIRYAQ